MMRILCVFMLMLAVVRPSRGDSYLMGGSDSLCWVSKYVKGVYVSGPGSDLSQENSIPCPSGTSIEFTTPKPG
jgi:hypothetical protein